MKKILYISYIIIIVLMTFTCKKDTSKQSDENPADSRNNIINASEINKKIKSGENIKYENATIIGDINFLVSEEKYLIAPRLFKHKINSSVIFYNCTFKGNIFAQKTYKDYSEVSEFDKNLTFIECTFQDSVNFTSCDFNDLVNFTGSIFHEFVTFKSSYFKYRRNYFNKAHFYKDAMFNLMKADGNMNFFETIFEGNVIFQLSKFNDPVQFNAAKFNKNSVFSSVKFYDDVFYNYAEFAGKVTFNNTIFKGRTEFIKNKFFSDSDFKDCIFYGKTKYNNSELNKVLTFEGSSFLINKPDINEFDLKKGAVFTPSEK